MTTTNTTPARQSALEPERVVMGLGKVAVGTCVRSTDGVPGLIYLRIPGEARNHDESCGDIFPVGDAAPEGAVLACIYFLTAETVLQSIGTLQQLLAEHFPDALQSSGNPGPLAAVERDADLSELERRALVGLIDLAAAAWCAADDSMEDENPDYIHVDKDSMKAMNDAIDVLEELPDDRPGYTLGPSGRAEWALRRFFGGTTVMENDAAIAASKKGAAP